MNKVFIAGASGGIGSAIVFELLKQGIEVVAFARNIKKLHKLFGNEPLVTCLAGDTLKEEEVKNAAKGTNLIIHTVGFPYQDWNKTQMLCLTNLLSAAKKENASFIIVDNIYAYSKSQSPINERARKEPPTKKGEIRLQMEQLIKSSGVKYMICHVPDVYGPRALSTHLHVALEGVVKNKRAVYIGPLHTRREFAYTEDVARIVVELSKRSQCYQQNWNIPGGLRVTGHELQTFLREKVGYRKKFMLINKSKLNVIGLFSPFMRELKEMLYLCEEPIMLDGSKLLKELGKLDFANKEKSLIDTYQWIQNNSAAK